MRALLTAFALGAVGALAMAPAHMAAALFVALSGLYLCLADIPTPRRGGGKGGVVPDDHEYPPLTPPCARGGRVQEAPCARGGRASAFAIGYAFGLGYFLPSLYWVGNALLVPGNPYWWAWPFAALGLPALMAAFPAAACALARAAPLKTIGGFAGFVAALTAAEWVRGHVATGLPWALYGYAWGGHLPVLQIAALGDIYWLTLLTVFWAALPGFLLAAGPPPSRRVLALALIGLGSLMTAYLWGAARLAAHPTAYDEAVAVRVVQPNIAQEDKWAPDKVAQNFRRRILLSYPSPDAPRAPTTLIVWPETALTRGYLDDPDANRALGALLRAYEAAEGGPGRAYLLTGFVEWEQGAEPGGARYYNALALIGLSGDEEDGAARLLHRYDKAHLVPFGETIPFADWLPLGPLSAVETFTPGPGPGALDIPGGGPRLAAQVCYEGIFPGVVEQIGGGPVAAIVNVTNDAWYGASPGPYQHFAQTRVRAIEAGAPLVRAAGTGVSGVVDPLGRVLARVPLFSQRALHILLPRPAVGGRDFAPILRRPWARNLLFWSVLAALGLCGAWATIRGSTRPYT